MDFIIPCGLCLLLLTPTTPDPLLPVRTGMLLPLLLCPHTKKKKKKVLQPPLLLQEEMEERGSLREPSWV